MALNLPLLALYTLSVGSKRKREADQARAKARADSKVTNWVMGATGIRALGDNENLKDGDAKYGFSIGNSKTINQFPKEEAEFFDLFENPYDKNSPPITKKQFDILNKTKAGVDSTKVEKLGVPIGYRSPADNKPYFHSWYKPNQNIKNTFQQQGKVVKGVFVPRKDTDTWDATHTRQVTKSDTENSFGKVELITEPDKQEIETQEDGYLDSNNRFVPINSSDTTTKSTHTRTIKKVGTRVVSTGIPTNKVKTQKASEILTTVRYYDSNGDITTNPSEAVKFDKIKNIGGEEKVVEQIQDMSKAANQELTTFFDKNGKVTSDPSQAVQQQTNTFDETGLLKQGKLQEVKTSTPSATTTEDFLITVRKDGKVETGMAIAKFGMTKEEVYEGLGDTVDIKKIVTTKDGVTTSKDFNTSSQAKASNSATDGNTYGVINLKSSENKANGFGKKNIQITMDRRLAGYGNLMNFNRALQQDSTLVNQINSNDSLYSQAMSNIAGEVREYFLDDFNKGDGVASFKNLPKNPSDAIRKIKSLVGNTGIAQIKNFDQIVLNAAGMLGDEAAKDLMASTPVNQGENILVVKGKTTDGGTAMIGVNYPSEFKDIVTKKLPQYVKSSDADQITATIASLIKTKKNSDGTDMFVENAEGKKVRVLDDEQGLLTFIKDLDSRVMIGKKVTINGVERNASLLDGFFSILHPYPSQAPAGNIIGDDRKYILNAFTTLAANNFTEARKLIMGFTDVNQDMVDRTIEQLHGGDTGNIKVRQEIQGKATSAFNAIITIDSMEDTYQINGRDININTQQGELIVKLSGMKETAMRAYRFLKGEKVIDIVSSSVEDVNSQLIDQDDVYDSINSNDPAEQQAKAKNKAALAEIKEIMKGNLGKGTDFMQRAGIGEASGFVKSMPKAMRDAYSKGALGKDVIRKLAIRQYHKYMLAYQLAAAIQGGTGGRTISDQDVQNILSALNFGFFTEASLEKATLQEARKMMTSIYEYNNALLNKDTKVQYSAIKARELLFEGNKAPYLGVGNLGNLRGVKARRSFIMNKLLNTKSDGDNNTKAKVDKEETEQTKKLMEAIKNNK
jgi:hypothetical protein